MVANRGKIDTHSLTAQEFEELKEVSRNVFAFAKHVSVIDPVIGKVPFDLYPFQTMTLYDFLKHKFNVILKFRQAGVTELISLFCLWFAMFHPYKTIVIISIKDRVAKKVLRKIKFMYKSVPNHLKTTIVNGRGSELGTSYEIEFSNGSLISSIPTTEDAGRSEALSLLVIDEAAIIRWAERIWAASWPTLSTGGRAIINSTAYGVGNFFHKLFVNSVAGGNVFNPIRLKWQMHPKRYRFEGDMEWYNMQRQILGPRKTAQEIDGDFLTSGNTVFDLADIRDIEDSLDEYVPIELHENGQLRVFKHPIKGEKYFLGADIATGRSQDYTAFNISNREGEEYMCYKGKIPIDRAEKLMVKWARKYNKATLAPESNDIGLGVATNLQTHGYPNLYYSKQLLRKKGQARPVEQEIPGWYTTKKNRPVIIAALEDDIRNQTCTIKNKFFCDESYTFIYDSRNRPIAMNKDSTASDELFQDEVYTDDAIFGEAITNWIRKERTRKLTILPK